MNASPEPNDVFVFSASFAQRRLWLVDQLDPGNPAYNIPAAVRFHGGFDVGALERALNVVVQRHETLRTNIVVLDDEPKQVIVASRPLHVRVVDLGDAASDDGAVGRLIDEETLRPFDLASDPLLRVVVYRRGPEDHIVQATIHHIVADGWSMGILLHELSTAYGAERTGTPPTLPDLPIQYADFAEWQQEWLRGDVLARQLDYWRRQLAHPLPVIELPTDRPRPAVRTFAGASVPFTLNAAATAALATLAREEQATLFMALLAVFKALLFRYTGQEDVTVGSPMANRGRREVEPLIGFFANTIVLRTRLSGRTTLRELVRSVRDTALAAYAHQDLPFERIVEAVQPERSLSRTPLFQVLFALQNTPSPATAVPGAHVSPLTLESRAAKFDLSLSLAETPAGLAGAAEYSVDLFDRATIERLAHHYGVLAGAASTPDVPIGRLPLLTHDDQQAIAGWNRTAVAIDGPHTVHECFDLQAGRTPDHPAVVFENETVTFGELQRRAGHLAAHLRDRQVGPETIVAVRMERSIDLVVALLGVLKAGGAFLPLDPSYPRERLDAMVSDSGAALTLDRVPPCAHEPASLRGSTTTADNAAYVIFTSGSTGRPKGAVNTHRAIVNRLRWMQREYGVAPGDRFLQKTPISFDVSLWELFTPLIAGATLVVARPGGHQDPAYLREVIDRHGITFVHFVPAMLRVFMERPPASRCRSLRHVICSGEALAPDLRDVCARALDADISNLYGPTEAAVEVTFWRCGRGEHGRRVPIGRPIANARMHIVDEGLAEVPAGVAGELLIGGVPVARGYIGRPDLTAERFVPDPFSGVPGARLYRTGDVARYRADGAIEFEGRRDHQLKVRGCRVELGEIEATTASQPGVRECLVLAQGDRSDDVRLTAYLRLSDHVEFDAAALRSAIAERLPAYMLPGGFIVVDEFPRLPSGKIDRARLPETGAQRPQGTGAGEPPQGDLEEMIAGLWRDALQVPHVGARDNFFDAGGHSLLAVHVVGKLRERLGRDIPLIDLFAHPTVRALARHLGEAPGAGASPPAPDPAPAHAAAAGPANVEARAAATDVAIIGMAGRFPGAPTIGELWQNLSNGVESIARFTDDEVIAAGVDPALVSDPHYVKAWGVLDDIEQFDAAFFGLGQREADIMDPQQRIFLECAWEALEDAGHDAARDRRPVGVYAGMSMNTYMLSSLMRHPGVVAGLGAARAVMGNLHDYLATRVSYALDLRGPSLTVQTACSTSLVAVHLAWRALLNGECDVALAGGVSISVPQRAGYLHTDGDIHSADGRCRTFDAAANGVIGGSGVGIVVLKRLADALADGDRVLAVIKGSAISNDGAGKVGYTAPSVDGQARVIASAMQAGDVPADTIDYIEAHGTATAIGDPIEVAALARVFPAANGRVIGLGSLKTNVGHLDAAAGVAGLIKATLALMHRAMPPSLHFERPNPRIDWAATPFRVVTRLQPWARGTSPRRAGVSSFGIGGTNAHAVLEEAPSIASDPVTDRPELYVVSARTSAACEAARLRLAAHLETHRDLRHADVAWTLQTGRRAFDHRAAVVARSGSDAIDRLRRPRGDAGRSSQGRRRGRCAFLFPGQGSQYPRMAQGLSLRFDRFRETLERSAAAMRADLDVDLLTLLGDDGDAARWRQTQYSQPALFAVEYALADLLMDLGATPVGLLGHSLGELVAASIAGVFSLETACAIVVRRGRLMAAAPPGAMVAVSLGESEVAAWTGAAVTLAAVNGPSSCVLAGPPDAVADLESRLTMGGIAHLRLPASHAFHSPLMDETAGRVAAVVAEFPRAAPTRPFVSNVTGTWIEPADACDPSYWGRQLRAPVRFADGVRAIAAEAGQLVEVGPGAALGALARQTVREVSVVRTLPTPGDAPAAEETFLGSIGRIWENGGDIDWTRLHHRGRRRVALPTYPFERQRHWVSPLPPLSSSPPPEDRSTSATVAAPGAIAAAVSDVWHQILGGHGAADDHFFDRGGDSLLATQLVNRLRRRLGRDVPLRLPFDHPTLGALTAALEAGAPATPAPVEGITPRAAGDAIPLSFAQQRLWFLDRIEGPAATYNMPGAFDLEGTLDAGALARALSEIVRRHEPLRTRLQADAGVPRQVIAPAHPLDLSIVDVREVADPEAEAATLADAEARTPFDLARDLPLRARLIRRRDHAWTLLVTLHHTAADGWSLGIFLRELGVLYAAFREQRPSPLPDLPIQYADFAVWQRGWLGAGDGTARESDAAKPSARSLIDYWTRRLRGAPGLLGIPTDRPRPPVQTFVGAAEAFALDSGVTARLRQIGRETGATPFMVLLAGYMVLLSRWSRRRDVVVGAPVAGRTRAETEPLIGLFVNMLVLRGDLAGRPTFRELLTRIRDMALDAYAHQDLPFEQLVDALRPERRTDSAPIVQVVFLGVNGPPDRLELPGLRLAPRPSASTWSKFDLTLGFVETGGAMTGTFEYNTDLFDQGTVSRMADHLRAILDAAAAAPDAPVERMPIAASDRRLLDGFNARTQPRDDRPVPARVASFAGTHPHHPAIVDGPTVLTYRDLDQRSSWLADRLMRMGVVREAPVAICLKRSASSITATLAVLKAGGICVPLDPSSPVERSTHLLHDSGATLVIGTTTGPAAVMAAAVPGMRIVDAALLDRWTPETDGRVSARPRTDPDQLAYVIHVPGEAGAPTGVAISHRALSHLVDWHTAAFEVTAADRSALVAGVASDASVWETWPYLTRGATIHVVDAAAVRQPAALPAWFADRGITIAFLPTPLADQAVRADWSGSTLRWLLTGRERLQGHAPADLPFKLVTIHGRTEAAVVATSESATGNAALPLPWIGRPAGDAPIDVVDERFEPVPIGVPGEVVIAGSGLARGYHGRADLTAERFRPNPFGPPGTRLFRSGDLGRWRADGTIEFLGRLDREVEVRGVRVDLGEVEAALATHPDVARAVATISIRSGASPAPDDRHDPELVAYVVTRRGDTGATLVTPADLRQHLRRQVPADLVPSALVMLDTLPTTAGGVVDCRALPAPRESGRAPGSAGPASPLERTIASIWTEVLNVDAVGAEENFFDAGGHSLKLVEAHERLQQALGRAVRLVDLFRYPTIRSLAAHVASGLLPDPVLSVARDRGARQREALGKWPLGAGQP